MSEMKLCPFCGGIPEIDGRSEDVRVRCETGCKAIGRSFYFDSDDDDAIAKAESDAIEAWNRRVPSAEVSRLTAERDALRAALLAARECADEAYDHWDADREVKAGKMLMAIAGHIPGYDVRTDAIDAALKDAP